MEEEMEPDEMKDVWAVADVIISPLGKTSAENFQRVLSEESGVTKITTSELSSSPIFAGHIKSLQKEKSLTRFETMCIQALKDLVSKFKLPADRTLLILSTTKGNIDLLKDDSDHSRLPLHAVADLFAKTIGVSKSIVVSNACISGVMAITVAKRLLQSDKFDHAIVLGADELTNFVVSGFQSLSALSDEPARPFDASRKGINLGEAAAAILLSKNPKELGVTASVKILGSGLSNDANHISGPSRTGEELAIAIRDALTESDLTSEQIDFISAHGTATSYNDEMESKAFDIVGMNNTPINSLKGYYGHTLGAAGVLEIILSIHALKNQTLIPSLNYAQHGVSKPLNIITRAEKMPLQTFLKTASGFGGCNAAIIIQKVSSHE